jgi:UDP-N-acetylmuramate-alanine ligase
MAEEIVPLLTKNDLVLTLGAGNIVKVGEKLLTVLESGN